MVIRTITLAMLLAGTPAYADSSDDLGSVPDWTYDHDTTGQESWGTMKPDYMHCEMGTEQSPVNVGETKVTPMPPLVAHYKQGKVKAYNNARGVTVEFLEKQTLIYENTSYHLKLLMLHSPSEHTIKNNFYMIELQFVHESDDGKKLILSTFGKIGYQQHAELQLLLDNAPKTPGKPSEFTLNPSHFLTSLNEYLAYTGSLTIPPCTEDVQWVLLKKENYLTKEQLKSIGKLVQRNARLPQPLYMRVVRETP